MVAVGVWDGVGVGSGLGCGAWLVATEASDAACGLDWESSKMRNAVAMAVAAS